MGYLRCHEDVRVGSDRCSAIFRVNSGWEGDFFFLWTSCYPICGHCSGDHRECSGQLPASCWRRRGNYGHWRSQWRHQLSCISLSNRVQGFPSLWQNEETTHPKWPPVDEKSSRASQACPAVDSTDQLQLNVCGPYFSKNPLSFLIDCPLFCLTFLSYTYHWNGSSNTDSW